MNKSVSLETRIKISNTLKEHHKNHTHPFKGKHHTEESNRKNRESSIKRFEKQEERDKISKSLMGHIPWNKGKKTGHTPWNKGKIGVYSEDTLKQISGSLKKRADEDPQYRLHCALANKGRKHTEDWKQSASERTKKEKHWNWQGGITPERYCELFNAEFRERCRMFFGYVCAECGTPQWANIDKSGKWRKLHVHHIHYDKKMCCNGSPRDVIVLCTSCNIKANGSKKFSREYWEHHFTDMIYEYYGGKCYLTKEEMKSCVGL